MEIRRKDDDRRTEVTLVGEVDLQTSPRLRTLLLELQKRRREEIVVDLAGVTYIDSSGLATLIECLHRVRGYGGRLRLVGMREEVYSVFALARLDRIFDIERAGPSDGGKP